MNIHKNDIMKKSEKKKKKKKKKNTRFGREESVPTYLAKEYIFTLKC